MPNRSIHQLPLATSREPGDLFYMVRGTTDHSVPSSILAPQVYVSIVQVTTAQVLALFTTPIAITPAIPAGQIAIPVRAFLRFEAGGSADYATNTSMVLGSESEIPAGGGILLVDLADRTLTPVMMGEVGYYKMVAGDSLAVSVLTGNPTTGDSNLVVELYYNLLDA